MNSQERIWYLDLLRVISMFFVIVIHATAYIGGGYENRAFASFFSGISQFCVPIFVMVSGAVFLNPEHELKMKKYIIRIIVAYVVWSFLYAVYHSNILFEHTFNNLYVFVVHWGKGNFHLWYLWMLMGLYLLVPVLRQVAKDKKASIRLIIICILFGSVPQFIDSLILIKPVSVVFETNLSGIVNNYLLLMPSMYVGYFLLGNYLNKSENINIKNKVVFGIALLMYIIAVVGLGVYASIKQGKSVIYDEYTTPLQIIMSVGIFLFIKSFKFEKTNPIIRDLSFCSFGIYLIHPFVQSGLNKVGLLHIEKMNFALNVLTVSILTFFISFIIVYLLKKIPIVNKYLV